MKLAILGASPLALETALRFHHYGAELTWFNFEEELEDLVEHSSSRREIYVSEIGRELLRASGFSLASLLDWKSWKETYYLPLSQILRGLQDVKPYQLVSITKRYLSPQESIEGKTRFYDLFRIIFQLNPEEFIRHQKETNPDTYEKLSEEFIQSLQSSLEMYEDFDVVIDMRRTVSSSSIAATGRAQGEGRVSQDKIHYGLQALKMARGYEADSQVRELALVGSGALAADILLGLEQWLKDERNRLFVISTESSPFDHALTELEEETGTKLRKLFEELEQEFEQEVNQFQQKLRDWQQLDDFVQVKIPKPVEPIPRLNFFSGHNVTAIDQLIDKQRVFLTLEKPDFRAGVKHPENNHLDLKTIGVDQILVASPRLKKSIICPLGKDETGFFSVKTIYPTIDGAWESDLKALKEIEDAIFKLFSPAGAH